MFINHQHIAIDSDSEISEIKDFLKKLPFTKECFFGLQERDTKKQKPGGSYSAHCRQNNSRHIKIGQL